MRRCGHNPTDIEVSDIINKIHDDTGSLNFEVRSVFLVGVLIIHFRISTTSWRKGLEIQIRRRDTRWILVVVVVKVTWLVVVGMFQSFQ